MENNKKSLSLWILAGLLFFVPLVISRQTSEIFGLIKVSFCQYIVLILLVVWLLKANIEKKITLAIF